ncbi:MAG: SO_0444 family Cu/Zn efflux transporter, partial [Gammaproteobacteria bacterium]|nr:SO_0444 family Cu/Zn efflux transporter [Gammaproteobacteria bacterium]
TIEATVIEFIGNFWQLLTDIAIYILLGVLIAGVIKQFLPDSFIKKHLGQTGFMSNIKAAIIGIPLPLCSCSVIPFVSALRKSGASKSSIQTFLISTPITGADSILATYGVMGWAFTIYRTITSVVISLLAGILSRVFIKEEQQSVSTEIAESDSCCSSNKVKEITKETSCCSSNQTNELNSCCSSTLSISKDESRQEKQSLKETFINILAYAFDNIYKDIAKSMIIGLLLGSLIMTFMPENLTEYLSGNLLLNYLLIILIAMPLYVCATSSVPMGIALLIGGFSPGAVFIFLTAGPATNAITMSVVHKSLGKNSLIVYLSSILIGSLAFALILDVFFTEIINDIMATIEHKEVKGWLQQSTGVIMLYLSYKYIMANNYTVLWGRKSACCAD